MHGNFYVGRDPCDGNPEMYLDDYNELRNFWVPLTAFSALLGVCLIILGIAVAGLIHAKRKQTDRRSG
jgi:hypothetical protein